MRKSKVNSERLAKQRKIRKTILALSGKYFVYFHLLVGKT